MAASWFMLKWTGSSRLALAVLIGPMALYGIPAIIKAILDSKDPAD